MRGTLLQGRTLKSSGSPLLPSSVVSGSSAGGATLPLSPVYGLVSVLNVLDFGAKGDGRQVSDAAITTGTNVLTSATANFTAADVGKPIVVQGAGVSSSTPLATTISGVTNSTTVTLAANAGTTASGKAATWATDDTTAIQNAINAADIWPANGGAMSGGAVFFPPAIYGTTSQLNVTGSVLLLGSGTSLSNLDNDVGLTARPVCVIAWLGSSAGTMLYRNNASRAIFGGGLGSIAFDGCGVANSGVILDHCREGRYANLRIARCVTNGLVLTTSSANANDNTQHNAFVGVNLERAQVPLLLSGNAGNTANACHNSFLRLNADTKGSGPQIQLENADNNDFFGVYCTVHNAASSPAPASYLAGAWPSGGYGIYFGPRARSNYFHHVEPGANGTYSETPATAGNDNTIFGYDRNNAQAAPTLNTGAMLTWTESGLNSTGWHIRQTYASINAPTYGATVTPDISSGPWQTITVTNTTAFTIAAPTTPPKSTQTAELVIEVLNSSGGAMGAITWAAAFVFAGQTWTNPANGKKRFARFQWNGTTWVCTAIAAADY